MNKQIPHGPDNLYCPFWRKQMSKVCHTCPMWQNVRGKEPQGEDIFDYWNCAMAWQTKLLIDNAQLQRQTGAAVESFRNEMVRANENYRNTTALNKPQNMKILSIEELVEGEKKQE